MKSYAVLRNTSSLVLTNNKVSRVEPLADFFPRLENLVLINNRVASLSEVGKLAGSAGLRRLYLNGNPVAEQPDYRLQVIARLPQLKVLDFEKVRKDERTEAARRFGDVGGKAIKDSLKKLTRQDKIRLLIQRAKTVEELNALDVLFKSSELDEEVLDKKLEDYGLLLGDN